MGLIRGFTGKRKGQTLKIVRIDPPVTEPDVQNPITIPGSFDFSAALNSGLILLLEDI